VAAVATADKIVAAKTQQSETDEFLRAAVDSAIKVFSLSYSRMRREDPSQGSALNLAIAEQNVRIEMPFCCGA